MTFNDKFQGTHSLRLSRRTDTTEIFAVTELAFRIDAVRVRLQRLELDSDKAWIQQIPARRAHTLHHPPPEPIEPCGTVGRSDVDYAPLQLVADAFLCGRRVEVDPFIE